MGYLEEGGNFLLDIIVARLSEGVGSSSGKVFFNFSLLLRSCAPFHPAFISISLGSYVYFSME